MNRIALGGCTATPLAGYLKALGVLRVVGEQLDAMVRGHWESGLFVVTTARCKGDIANFFLHGYRPSPIVSPWSGRAGFLEGEDRDESTRSGAVLVGKIEASKGRRFEAYREAVSAAGRSAVIGGLDRERAGVKELEKRLKDHELSPDEKTELEGAKKRVKELKGAVLGSLRGELPDALVRWVDACCTLVGGDVATSPLLGSGGNEGSMDFSVNHIGCLLQLIEGDTDAPTELAEELIDVALYGEHRPVARASSIGFLDPAGSGGVNMAVGFDGEAGGDAWSCVLALEGVVLFASCAARRLGSGGPGRPTFPFAVSAAYAGDGSIGAKEGARPELWLPTWVRPASVSELAFLLSEGRAVVGKSSVLNGVDMLQALSSLGVDRGIEAFERYGIYERRGRGYFVATHLGRYAAPPRPTEDWVLDDLAAGGWLRGVRNFCRGKNAAGRFLVLCRRLEDWLFAVSGRELRTVEAQGLLALLGELQWALARSSKARKEVGPVPLLSERWVRAADDGTSAFRIACALAGLRGERDRPLPLRALLFPVHPGAARWKAEADADKLVHVNPYKGVRVCVGGTGRLPDLLARVLQRRLWIAEKLEFKDKPLGSAAGAMLDDVGAFLQSDGMDARIASLLPGLSLCAIPEEEDRSGGEGPVPAAYALLKLSFTPDATLRGLGALEAGERVAVPAGVVVALASGHEPARAVLAAWRRLRASGLSPAFSPRALPSLGGVSALRVAAALLIPLRFGAYGALARSVLQPGETS